MIIYADETVMHEIINPTSSSSYSMECRFSILDEELSHLIYAFTSCHGITDCALKHLGYSLSTGSHIISKEPGFSMNSTMLVNNWPLWTEPHVFCLLSGHMLSILRITDSIIILEDSIKSFWSNFLTSIQNAILSTWESSIIKKITVIEHCMMDIHPNLLQFTCFLAGQTPGLTAKKQLLILLTQLFCDLHKTIWKKQYQQQFITESSNVHISSVKQQITHVYYLWLRLIVILRYMLHYFYIPPNYLSHQLKPCMFLQPDQNNNKQKKCMIGEYSTIAQLSSKIHPYFLPLPLTDNNNNIPFFYDLLTAANQSSSGVDQSTNLTPVGSSSSKRTGTSLSLPSPDGLVSLKNTYNVNSFQYFSR